MAIAKLYQSSDTGAPALGDGGDGVFDVLAWALGAAGWTVINDAATLEVTPAEGSTATLRLTRDGDSFQPTVSDLLAALPILEDALDIRVKIIANLAEQDPWHTGLTDEEIVVVLSSLGVDERMPRLPDTPFARLPVATREKIVASVEDGKDWHSDLDNADFMAVYDAMNLSVYDMMAYYTQLPAAIASILIANYMAGRHLLYGLSREQLLQVVSVAGIAFTAADFDLTLSGGEELLALLDARLADAITANAQAGEPWSAGLSRADILDVASAAGADAELQALASIPPYDGLNSFSVDWRYPDVPRAWAIMADERAFVLLVGETAPLGEDEATPSLAVARYFPVIACGLLLNPGAAHAFLALGGDDGGLTGIYSAAAGADEGYQAFSPNITLYQMLASSGAPGWGPPLAVNAPWVQPYQAHAVESPDDARASPLVIGILPFMEMVMSHIDPVDCASGEQIAQNRWLFHTRAEGGGSLILRASDVPMTSLA